MSRPSFSWGLSTALGLLLVLMCLSAAGCSDDPILGPDEGSSDGSGGSYSVIKRLAPTDSAEASDSTQVSPANPERF